MREMDHYDDRKKSLLEEESFYREGMMITTIMLMSIYDEIVNRKTNMSVPDIRMKEKGDRSFRICLTFNDCVEK